MALSDSLPSVPKAAPPKFGLPSAPGAIKDQPPKFGLPPAPGAIAHSPAIKEMQEGIMELGETMSTHKAFNGFLTSRYDMHANPNTMLSVGVSQMHNGQNTWHSDGAWGSHTDAGLKEALNLAEALDKMAAQMNREGYDLGALKSLIPENHEGGNAEVAAKISAELNKLNASYTTLASFVEHRYGNKLNEEAAVVRYDTNALSKEEQEYAKAHENDGAVKLTDGTWVHLHDLTSTQALQSFFDKISPDGIMDAKTQAGWMLTQLEMGPAKGGQ